MERKYVEVLDATALAEGEMVALASTFGNIDKVGDRVVRGAFARSVAEIKAGAALPLIWGHDANGSPQNFVGEIVDADETAEGLEVRAVFDLEDPVGRKAYRLVKSGAIEKLSIGYSVRSERRARDANELLDVDLREVSLVLQPANEQARVLAIKADDERNEPTPSRAELERRMIELGIVVHKPDMRRVRDNWGDEIRHLLTGNGRSDDLKRRSLAAADLSRTERKRTELQHERKSSGPIRIATFECE